jgi:4-hydroxyphenylpyruvate dioxygenase
MTRVGAAIVLIVIIAAVFGPAVAPFDPSTQQMALRLEGPTGLHWFGIVQYIGSGRMADWTAFYEEMFGFRVLPEEQRYGVLPKGRILESACGKFFLQLVEPNPDTFDLDHEEMLQRVGLGTPDVLRTVAALRERGVGFVESKGVHSEARGALTQSWLGGVMFELVHDERR